MNHYLCHPHLSASGIQSPLALVLMAVAHELKDVRKVDREGNAGGNSMRMPLPIIFIDIMHAIPIKALHPSTDIPDYL